MIRVSDYKEEVDNRVIFSIPTVGRLDVLPGLRRVIESILRCAPANLTNFIVEIVVDMPGPGNAGGDKGSGLAEIRRIYGGNPLINIVAVPQSYVAPNGTLHKARANSYAMLMRKNSGVNTPHTWLVYLDDDTSVGPCVISAIAERIAQDTGKYHLFQGTLTHPFELTGSRICRLLDLIRCADDRTRFFFATHMLHTPIFGLHGELLVVRASIAQKIGWDVGGCRVEDAKFGLLFARYYPGCSAHLNAVAIGATPPSVGALVKQRERWCLGLVELVLFDRDIPIRLKLPLVLSVGLWAMGVFQHLAVVLAINLVFFHTLNTSPVHPVFSVFWSLSMTFETWMYVLGLAFNLERRSGWRVRAVWYGLATVLSIHFLSGIEAWASFRGVVALIMGKKTFDVVPKPQ